MAPHIYAHRWITAETATEIRDGDRSQPDRVLTYNVMRDAFVAWHIAPADDPRVVERRIEYAEPEQD